MAEIAKYKSDHKSTRSDPNLSPLVRFAWLYLHTMRTKDGKKQDITPRREITVLIPKVNASAADCPNYQWAARHVVEACTRQPGWGGFPPGGSWPIKDGDNPPAPAAPPPGQAAVPVDPNKYAYQRGHWVLVATNFSEIGPRICVMQGTQAIEIPAQVVAGKQMYKSGDYGHISLNAWTFHNKKFGAGFGFEGVLFTKEGELIGSAGGPPAAAAMFGGIATMAPAGFVPPTSAPMAPPPLPSVTAYAPPLAPAAPVAPVAPAYNPPPALPPFPGAPAR